MRGAWKRPQMRYTLTLALFLMILLIGGWEWIARATNTAHLFSMPTHIARELELRWLDGSLRSAVLQSTGRVLPWLLLGTIAGFHSALALVSIPVLSLWTKWISSVAIAFPKIAIIFIFLWWFDSGEAVKYAIVFYSAFFSQLFFVYHALYPILLGGPREKEESVEIVQQAMLDGANTLQLYRYIFIPMALPDSMRICQYTSLWVWPSLIIAESFAPSGGLGLEIYRGLPISVTAIMAPALVMLLCAGVTFCVVTALYRVLPSMRD